MTRVLFADRIEAGRRLAERLGSMARDRLVVLGLPRGGVPVASEVAAALGVPLDVILVRKLGVPAQPELAMGAIGEDGVRLVNTAVTDMLGIRDADVAAVERRERAELARRAARFRTGHARVDLTGCTALIVDDGIATGSTVRVACEVAREHGAARVVVATPVAPPHTVRALRDTADEVIALFTPDDFYAIGQFYRDFTQTTDDEVVRLLTSATPQRAYEAAAAARDIDVDVEVPVGQVRLSGHLTVPDGAHAVVVFAHGSGSSRHSTRNQYVARVLQQAGLGTLLFDLLTPAEERDRSNVFDIPLLASRLVAVTDWLRTQPGTSDLAVGYFGASTGAGAALWAAAELDAPVRAVVSRGGRPDLAAPRLAAVRAPTLLIVGGDDHLVLELNRDAQRLMRCPTHLSVVPGASHLFEEPGTLDTAAALARDWFVDRLSPIATTTTRRPR